MPTYEQVELAKRKGWMVGYMEQSDELCPYPRESDLGHIWLAEWRMGRNLRIVELGVG